MNLDALADHEAYMHVCFVSVDATKTYHSST